MSALDIDTSDPKEQRNFGIVMAIAISAVTLIHWLIRGHLAFWPFPVAFAFLTLGLVAPKALEPIFWAWMKLALALNWVVTRVLLSIVFFLLIVPFRVGIALFADDPMKRAWDPDAETYWEEAEEQPTDPSRYTNMY